MLLLKIAVHIVAMMVEHNLPYKVVAHPTRGLAGVQIKEGLVYTAEELVVSASQKCSTVATAVSHLETLVCTLPVHSSTHLHHGLPGLRSCNLCDALQRKLRVMSALHACARYWKATAYKGRHVWPSQLACFYTQASVLQYCKQIAEAQSGGPVPDAVIAVPGGWNLVSFSVPI